MGNFYIVFDLEATCWDQQTGENLAENYYKQKNQMETIEIGAVKVDFNYNILDKFQSFVKPVLNPVLTEFCKTLTTITQEDVDSAKTFKEVYKDFTQWADRPSRYIAWGQYDYNQLFKDCERSGIQLFSNDKYRNGKFVIQDMRGFPGKGLGQEVKRYGLEFEGTPHRGLCDAIMVSKVLQAALKENQKQHYKGK